MCNRDTAIRTDIEQVLIWMCGVCLLFFISKWLCFHLHHCWGSSACLWFRSVARFEGSWRV